RYMNGLFTFRTGAKGAWAWTLARHHGNPDNDFDSDQPGEYKEACILYPAAEGYPLRPTLQFEALRLGIQDYKALRTLESLLATSNNPKVEGIRTIFRHRIDNIPWENYTQFPNESMEELRAWVLEKIAELQ
ncbi:MAG: DUF4091 domain-containing protein, partial [Phycisphaerae bacterium]|nr:DUF4091 domain-containing protein [Phycisphaerae bacterium]